MSLGEYKPDGHATIVPPPLTAATVPGQRLGAYELLRILGEGSMGQVFLARHERLGRQVAIKILRPELARHSQQVGRFFQEARAVNQVNHQNIVQIIDFVQEPSNDAANPGPVYCVMELLGGQSLAGWFRSRELRIGELVEVGSQVCAALQAAHGAGVVHRDIKPDNIMVERREDRLFTKVVDFGVAKLMSPDVRLLESTSQGALIGTPLYMSPEQAGGESVDYRADIYALGAVLYEGLSGHTPFQSASLGGLFAQVIRDRAHPLPATTPQGEVIPLGLAAVVESCLAKDPAARPASMGALRGLMERNLKATLPPDASAPTEPPRLEARTILADVSAPVIPPVSAQGLRFILVSLIATVLLGGLALVVHGNANPASTPVAVVPPLPPLAGSPPAAAPVAPPIAPVVTIAVAPAPTVAPPLAEPPKAEPPSEPASEQFGELAVVSIRGGQPFFAAVFIDGRRLGNSPIQRGLVPGHHRVRLTRDGFAAQERDVVIRSGQTTRLRVEMTP